MLTMIVLLKNNTTYFNNFDSCDEREAWLEKVNWKHVSKCIEINGSYEIHKKPAPVGTNVEVTTIMTNGGVVVSESIARIHSTLPVDTVLAAFDDADGFMPQMSCDDYTVEADWRDGFENAGLPIVPVTIRVSEDGANTTVGTIR